MSQSFLRLLPYDWGCLDPPASCPPTADMAFLHLSVRPSQNQDSFGVASADGFFRIRGPYLAAPRIRLDHIAAAAPAAGP